MADEKVIQVVTATDWTGAQDPANPQNWPLPKKIYHTLVPTAVAFLCPFGSSVYTPSVTSVSQEFGVPREVALLPFCLYLLGLSFGPVIAAPASETFGRKYVYLTGLPLFGLFTLGAGFSKSIASVIVCRFFAGFFASPGLSIATGTISDVWRPEKRGLPMAALITSVQMGPAVAPTIGGFVVEYKSWRWSQWVILFALAFALTVTAGMSETYKKTILRKRAKEMNVEGPELEKLSVFLRKTIIRPIHMLLTETIVTLFDLYLAVNFGLLNAFFAAFPIAYQVYGFNLGQVGLTFLGQAVGTLIGFTIIVLFDRYFYKPTGPEQRLWLAMIGAPMISISLFWFGWTARADIHWISPVAAEGLFSCGNILIFCCSLLFFADVYGAIYGASAASSSTFCRYLFATAFPLFTPQMFEALGVNWASSLLGFVTLALIPIPFAFYVWGPRLRRNSKYTADE